MKCSKCGAELRDGAKFCPNCGATLDSAGAAGTAPSLTGAPAGGKRRGRGLIVAGVAAVAVVVAVAAAAVGGIFSSPQDKVEKAFHKTAAAYAEVSEKMGMPDLNQLTEEQSVSQRLSLELASVNEQLAGYDLSFLKGIGLRLDTDLDGAGRKMAVDLAAYWGADEILSAQLLAEDNLLSFSLPQFTGGDFYSVDTTTLGADLADWGVNEDLGFNLFDLLELCTPSAEVREQMEQAMAEASEALFGAMEVEKAGSETIDVNGKNVDADAYDVLIPQDAMEDYADALIDALRMMDYVGIYEEALRSVGLPEDQVDSLVSRLRDPYQELSDGIGYVLDELGDLELTVYVSGGCLSAVVYDDRGVEIGLYLGGGEEYVDDLSLEISADGGRVLIESSGDHAGKSGVFTDETVLRVQEGGETAFRLTSEYRYEPKAEDGNFLWEISVDDLGSLNFEGQMTTTDDSLSLVLEDISLRAMGMEVFALEGEYYMGPCEEIALSADGAERILELSDSELAELAMDWEDNAQDWLSDLEQQLYEKLPAELLWGLMYSFY